MTAPRAMTRHRPYRFFKAAVGAMQCLRPQIRSICTGEQSRPLNVIRLAVILRSVATKNLVGRKKLLQVIALAKILRYA